MLAVLLLRANEVVPTVRLVDELWGERAPPSAVQTVQVYVSRLRKLLGDQPSVATGAGAVWVSWNLAGSIVARGAPVTALGTWGPFGPQQAVPTATGNFGDIAVGPGGRVTVTYQDPTAGRARRRST